MGCCAQLSISRFDSRFIKKPDFGTLKMEKALFVGRNKIGFHGVPHHPKDHAHVRYGLIPTNYAMIRAEHSPFELKVVQPRMLWVIYVKGHSGKLLFSRFQFFLHLGDIK
jgi:hypothetical protein